MERIRKCHFGSKNCGKFPQCRICIKCYANPSNPFRNCDACLHRCPSCDADCTKCKLTCDNCRMPYGLF